jgi:hypothetical protein
MFNYNNDAQLFKNYRASNPVVALGVFDGHIHSCRDGYIARCTDDAEAQKILEEAGYKFEPDNDGNKYFKP